MGRGWRGAPGTFSRPVTSSRGQCTGAGADAPSMHGGLKGRSLQAIPGGLMPPAWPADEDPMSPLVRLRRYAPLAVAATCLASAPVASAVTLTSPVAGATVADPPTFTWTLGADEVPEALLVSDISRVDSGRLGTPFVDKGFGDATPTSFTYRGHGLAYAGTYFWQLVGFNQATSREIFPKPARFTVPGHITVTALKSFDARWSHDPYETGFRARTTCNFMNPVRTRLKITKGRRVVFNQRMADQTCGDAAHSQKLDIRYPGHVTAKGAHLKATVILSAGGVSASRTVPFVAY